MARVVRSNSCAKSDAGVVAARVGSYAGIQNFLAYWRVTPAGDLEGRSLSGTHAGLITTGSDVVDVNVNIKQGYYMNLLEQQLDYPSAGNCTRPRPEPRCCAGCQVAAYGRLPFTLNHVNLYGCCATR
jgi:hypothetical protein